CDGSASPNPARRSPDDRGATHDETSPHVSIGGLAEGTRRLHRLPVVQGDGELVGLLSLADVARGVEAGGVSRRTSGERNGGGGGRHSGRHQRTANRPPGGRPRRLAVLIHA